MNKLIKALFLFTISLCTAAENYPYDYQIIVDHHAKIEEIRIIQEGLIGYNIPFLGPNSKFNVFLKNIDGETVGGAIGYIFSKMKMLSLDFVFIPEPIRGQGYGRKLIEEVETEAKKQGCVSIVLATFSFQAEGFYDKLGFTRTGSFYFGDFEMIFMQKNLQE